MENAGVINEEEKFILDVLEDDGYLFSIAKAYESLNGISMEYPCSSAPLP